MGKTWLNFKSWVKRNPKEFWILTAVLLIGAFLRLYRIDEYMTFLGDEGRDVIVVRRLLVNFDPILIGPGTSIGNMYLGPLYYYMMAPALLLAWFSPVGPAIQIALLGILTIVFVWWIGRIWFGKWAGLIAASLYAVSPTVIIFSRSSWNPNIMPFFALLSVYAIWKIWKESSFKWLIILGISYAFVLQSHYLGLLLAPTLGLYWLITFLKVRKTVLFGEFIKKSLVGLGVFLFLMSPLVIFDARHGWRNFDAMKKFFTERQATVSARPWNALPKIYPLFEKVDTRLLAGRNEITGRVLSAVVVVLLLWQVWSNYRNKKSLASSAHRLLLTWLGFALIGLGLYKQEIYDHYYGFFFAAPFLLTGAISQEVLLGKRLIKVLLLVGYCLLIVVNLVNTPIRYPPNRQLQRTIEVTNKISDESRGEKFNLAVIAERNYEDAYQYFLEKDSKPVTDIDAQKPETITNQLFVVCELPKEKCDPTHNPKAEVANFGWSKVEDEWEVAGVIIYKLAHSQ